MADIQNAIFAALKEDPSISIKLNAGGGKYHIYPIELPEKALAENANYYITYGDVATRRLTFIDVEIPIYQVNALSKTFEGAVALKNDIVSLFERFKGNLGEERKVKFMNINDQKCLRDPDNNLFFYAIDVQLKYFGDNI